MQGHAFCVDFLKESCKILASNPMLAEPILKDLLCYVVFFEDDLVGLFFVSPFLLKKAIIATIFQYQDIALLFQPRLRQNSVSPNIFGSFWSQFLRL